MDPCFAKFVRPDEQVCKGCELAEFFARGTPCQEKEDDTKAMTFCNCINKAVKNSQTAGILLRPEDIKESFDHFAQDANKLYFIDQVKQFKKNPSCYKKENFPSACDNGLQNIIEKQQDLKNVLNEESLVNLKNFEGYFLPKIRAQNSFKFMLYPELELLWPFGDSETKRLLRGTLNKKFAIRNLSEQMKVVAEIGKLKDLSIDDFRARLLEIAGEKIESDEPCLPSKKLEHICQKIKEDRPLDAVFSFSDESMKYKDFSALMPSIPDERRTILYCTMIGVQSSGVKIDDLKGKNVDFSYYFSQSLEAQKSVQTGLPVGAIPLTDGKWVDRDGVAINSEEVKPRDSNKNETVGEGGTDVAPMPKANSLSSDGHFRIPPVPLNPPPGSDGEIADRRGPGAKDPSHFPAAKENQPPNEIGENSTPSENASSEELHRLEKKLAEIAKQLEDKQLSGDKTPKDEGNVGQPLAPLSKGEDPAGKTDSKIIGPQVAGASGVVEKRPRVVNVIDQVGPEVISPKSHSAGPAKSIDLTAIKTVDEKNRTVIFDTPKELLDEIKERMMAKETIDANEVFYLKMADGKILQLKLSQGLDLSALLAEDGNILGNYFTIDEKIVLHQSRRVTTLKDLNSLLASLISKGP